MERKNSFIMYTNYLEYMEPFSMKQRGELFTAVIQYQLGLEVMPISRMLRPVFAMIRDQLDRENEKYLRRCEENRRRAECRRMRSHAIASGGMISAPDNDNDHEDDYENDHEDEDDNENDTDTGSESESESDTDTGSCRCRSDEIPDGFRRDTHPHTYR